MSRSSRTLYAPGRHQRGHVQGGALRPPARASRPTLLFYNKSDGAAGRRRPGTGLITTANAADVGRQLRLPLRHRGASTTTTPSSAGSGGFVFQPTKNGFNPNRLGHRDTPGAIQRSQVHPGPRAEAQARRLRRRTTDIMDGKFANGTGGDDHQRAVGASRTTARQPASTSGVAPLPNCCRTASARPRSSACRCSCVNSRSKHVKESWDLIRYLSIAPRRCRSTRRRAGCRRLMARGEQSKVGARPTRSRQAVIAAANNGQPMPNIPEMGVGVDAGERTCSQLLVKGRRSPPRAGGRADDEPASHKAISGGRLGRRVPRNRRGARASRAPPSLWHGSRGGQARRPTSRPASYGNGTRMGQHARTAGRVRVHPARASSSSRSRRVVGDRRTRLYISFTNFDGLEHFDRAPGTGSGSRNYRDGAVRRRRRARSWMVHPVDARCSRSLSTVLSFAVGLAARAAAERSQRSASGASTGRC